MSRNSVACVIQFLVLLGYDVKYGGGSDIFAVSGPGDHAKIDTIMNYAKYQNISEQGLVKRGFKQGFRLSFLKKNAEMVDSLLCSECFCYWTQSLMKCCGRNSIWNFRSEKTTRNNKAAWNVMHGVFVYY